MAASSFKDSSFRSAFAEGYCNYFSAADASAGPGPLLSFSGSSYNRGGVKKGAVYVLHRVEWLGSV